MLADQQTVFGLIPQRPPMVMVDRLISCDEQATVTQLQVKADNVFAVDGYFSSGGMIEAMAQTAAVRTGWLLKQKPGGGDKKAPVGVIGSIKNFRLHFQPPAGAELTITVEVLVEVMQATVVKGRVEAEGRLAAEAELQIFLTGD